MKMSRLMTAFFVFRNSALPKKCFAFNEVKFPTRYCFAKGRSLSRSTTNWRISRSLNIRDTARSATSLSTPWPPSLHTASSLRSPLSQLKPIPITNWLSFDWLYWTCVVLYWKPAVLINRKCRYYMFPERLAAGTAVAVICGKTFSFLGLLLFHQKKCVLLHDWYR